MEDLFTATREYEIERRAQDLAEERLQDPSFLRGLLSQYANRAEVAERQRDDLLAKFRRYFDSEGYIDAAQAAATLRIPYINPTGKTQPMGRNYALLVLERDGVVIRAANGYRLSSAWEKSGKGVSRVVTRNDVLRSVALFNGSGVEALIKKYDKDQRVWRSNSDHEVWCE